MENIQSGGVYKFINAKAGNCMDLSGGDNTSVIGFDYHGGDNQKWRLEQIDEGWFIQNMGNRRFLNIAEGPHDDAKVIATDEPREWRIQPDEEDPSTLRFFVPGTPFNLDLSDNGNPTPGNPLSIWGKWEGRNQCWRLEEA